MSEIKYLESRLGYKGETFGVIILIDWTEIDFYRQLFDFNYSTFNVNQDKKYVYLIYNEQNNFFKIGYSKNPLKRKKTLQGQEPNIALLKVWEKDVSFEKFLHKKYYKNRIRGEWFEFSFQELWELREL